MKTFMKMDLGPPKAKNSVFCKYLLKKYVVNEMKTRNLIEIKKKCIKSSEEQISEVLDVNFWQILPVT